jgi:hypothetical protein
LAFPQGILTISGFVALGVIVGEVVFGFGRGLMLWYVLRIMMRLSRR